MSEEAGTKIDIREPPLHHLAGILTLLHYVVYETHIRDKYSHLQTDITNVS